MVTQVKKVCWDSRRLWLDALTLGKRKKERGGDVAFPDMIYDRTLADVEAGNAKGFYNIADLNRVGQAVAWLGTAFNQYCYPVVVTPKVDWLMTDFPNQSDMAVYLANITALITAYYVPVEIPSLPSGMAGLDYEKANAIEKILADLKKLFDNMLVAFFYSGVFYAGEELVL